VKRIVLIFSALAIAGCATSSPPRVSGFNGDSVNVTVYCGMAFECSKPRPEDLAQAEKTCATRGRKAQFASTAFRDEVSGTIVTTAADHLYLCV
jgi:hypothetical protein